MIVDQIIRATPPLSFTISSSATCNDIHNCRTVPSIIINCASTIFLCTWVALHLDVPKDPWEAWWKTLLRRVGWMMVALLAPEAVLVFAISDWITSSEDLMDKVGQDPTCSWTETHALLAKMGGLRVVAEDGSKKMVYSLGSVPNNIEMPTKKEIQDRGKGDTIAKAITIIQTLWFAIQAARRVNQDLIVTELELTALGHVVLNIFIYWCWWNKPLNLQFPVDVYAKKGEERRSNNQNAMELESQGQTSSRRLTFRVRLGADINRNTNDWSWEAVIMLIFIPIIGGMFGAIHCLAWNSTFPTPVEHLLWRVSALVVAAFPGLLFVVSAFLTNALDMNVPSAIIFFTGAVYCLGRVCLLALALAALRVLPQRAYEVPSWAVYIPQIG